MVYPSSHLYWTFHWDTTAAPDEEAQIGLRTTGSTPPTLTLLEDVGDAFSAFWTATNNKVSGNFRFYRAKCAAILPDGKYDPDFDAAVHDRTPVPGAAGSTSFPLQVAHVLTLTTDRTSGPANKGRVYLPPIQATANGYLYNITDITNRATSFAAFLSSFNALMGTEQVSVFSQVGAGARRPVLGVSSDMRPDIQRRRGESVAGTRIAPLPVTP